MSTNYRELLSAVPPEDTNTNVPFARTAMGKYHLLCMFNEYDRVCPSPSGRPTMAIVNDLLITLDAQLFPFNTMEDDAGEGDKLKAHCKLATMLWKTLLAEGNPSPSPSVAAIPPTAPPTPQPPTLGDQRAAAIEARKLAEEIERARLRSVCADLNGPGAQGGNFTNEFVTSRASELFIGQTQLLDACAALACKLLGVSPFDADGITPTAPELILAKIPQDTSSLPEWTSLIQAVESMEEASSLLFKGWRTMSRSFETSWRHMVQIKWQDQEDAAERRINKAHPVLKTFEDKLAMAILKLKAAVPGTICPAAAVGLRNSGPTTTSKKDEAGSGNDRPARAAPKTPKKPYERKKYDAKPYDRDQGYYAGRKINYDRESDRGAGGKTNGGARDHGGGGARDSGGGGARDHGGGGGGDYDRDRRGGGGGYYRGRGGRR
jgi:hypothetical protein